MPIVNVKSDMDRILSEVNAEREQLPKAAARALNLAARRFVTDAASSETGLRKRYPKLKLKDITPLFTVTQLASPSLLQALIQVRGRPLSLLRFVTKVVTKRGQGGVYVNIKGVTRFFPHAWVQTLKNKSGDDYQVLFVRETGSRFPIEVKRTINIPNAIHIPEVYALLETQVTARFDKEFERQLLLK